MFRKISSSPNFNMYITFLIRKYYGNYVRKKYFIIFIIYWILELFLYISIRILFDILANDSFHIFSFQRESARIFSCNSSSSNTSILISRLIKRMTLQSPRVSISATGVKASGAIRRGSRKLRLRCNGR